MWILTWVYLVILTSGPRHTLCAYLMQWFRLNHLVTAVLGSMVIYLIAALPFILLLFIAFASCLLGIHIHEWKWHENHPSIHLSFHIKSLISITVTVLQKAIDNINDVKALLLNSYLSLSNSCFLFPFLILRLVCYFLICDFMSLLH